MYPNPHPEIPSFKPIFNLGLPKIEARHFASSGQEFVSEFRDRDILSGCGDKLQHHEVTKWPATLTGRSELPHPRIPTEYSIPAYNLRIFARTLTCQLRAPHFSKKYVFVRELGRKMSVGLFWWRGRHFCTTYSCHWK